MEWRRYEIKGLHIQVPYLGIEFLTSLHVLKINRGNIIFRTIIKSVRLLCFAANIVSVLLVLFPFHEI